MQGVVANASTSKSASSEVALEAGRVGESCRQSEQLTCIACLHDLCLSNQGEGCQTQARLFRVRPRISSLRCPISCNRPSCICPKMNVGKKTKDGDEFTALGAFQVAHCSWVILDIWGCLYWKSLELIFPTPVGDAPWPVSWYTTACAQCFFL